MNDERGQAPVLGRSSRRQGDEGRNTAGLRILNQTTAAVLEYRWPALCTETGTIAIETFSGPRRASWPPTPDGRAPAGPANPCTRRSDSESRGAARARSMRHALRRNRAAEHRDGAPDDQYPPRPCAAVQCREGLRHRRTGDPRNDLQPLIQLVVERPAGLITPERSATFPIVRSSVLTRRQRLRVEWRCVGLNGHWAAAPAMAAMYI